MALPCYGALPAGPIGCLAVGVGFHRKPLGSALTIDTIRRVAGADPAIFALSVDTRDESAAAFHLHLEFNHFISRPMSLFLPAATESKAVEAAGH